MPRQRIAGLALSGWIAALSALPLVAAAQDITVYSTRDPKLTVPILDGFTREANIQVRYVHFDADNRLLEQLSQDGDKSRADLIMTADIGSQFDIVRAGHTQAISLPKIESVIPEQLRHPTGHWFALSYRIRAIYVSRARVSTPPPTYESLADEQWHRKLCIRSGTHPYNVTLLGALIAKHGEGTTAFYLQSLKYNLARKAAGGDRDVARDIANNVCDVGVANTYYMGLMLSGAGGPEQKRWAEAVKVVLPSFQDGAGSHMNVSAVSLARNAPNKDRAIRLLEYLTAPAAQKQFADVNFEYPARADVAPHAILASFGTPRLDNMALTIAANNRQQARELVLATGFDN